MSGKPVIGFIGVGLMGHGMAKNILEGGYRLNIKGNLNRGPIDNLVQMGAIEVQTAAEMAKNCDIIHLCLSNSPQVESIVRGPDGILEGARPGLIVIDTTTADPTSTLALAADLQAVGAQMIDVPLGRTPKEAESGTLDAMVGGPAEIVAVVRPVIDCWAGSVTHVGEVGAGHKMKLIMNFMAMSYGAIYAEALALAVKSDLTPQVVRDVMGKSRMGCGFFDTFMSGAVGRDPEAHKFTLENAAKDVRYVANMAFATDVANPLGAAVRNTYVQAVAVGKGGNFVPTLADHVAELNGVDLAEAVRRGAK